MKKFVEEMNKMMKEFVKSLVSAAFGKGSENGAESTLAAALADEPIITAT